MGMTRDERARFDVDARLDRDVAVRRTVRLLEDRALEARGRDGLRLDPGREKTARRAQGAGGEKASCQHELVPPVAPGLFSPGFVIRRLPASFPAACRDPAPARCRAPVERTFQPRAMVESSERPAPPLG